MKSAEENEVSMGYFCRKNFAKNFYVESSVGSKREQMHKTEDESKFSLEERRKKEKKENPETRQKGRSKWFFVRPDCANEAMG